MASDARRRASAALSSACLRAASPAAATSLARFASSSARALAAAAAASARRRAPSSICPRKRKGVGEGGSNTQQYMRPSISTSFSLQMHRTLGMQHGRAEKWAQSQCSVTTRHITRDGYPNSLDRLNSQCSRATLPQSSENGAVEWMKGPKAMTSAAPYLGPLCRCCRLHGLYLGFRSRSVCQSTRLRQVRLQGCSGSKQGSHL